MGRVPILTVLLLVPSFAHAQCPGEEPGFVADVARILWEADRRWWDDRPLSDARNAHRTNTVEEVEDALDGDYNWWEGDIRAEINHPDRLEMRHDEIHESGDNLTLAQWLERGRRAGVGLKLDVKESKLMPQLLDTVERSGVAHEKLMFNLGDGDMERFGAEIRQRFPEAILAINPTKKRGGRENDGPLQQWQIDRLLEHAATHGGKVTFVLHEGQVTPDAVEQLQQYGPVSIWGNVDDPGKRRAELEALGVEGMMDLGEKHGIGVGDVADHVKNRARTWFDRTF